MIGYYCSSRPWILYPIVRIIAAKLKVRAYRKFKRQTLLLLQSYDGIADYFYKFRARLFSLK